MTTGELLLWSAVISFIGGAASALRSKTATVRSAFTVAINTMVLGMGIALMGNKISDGDPDSNWAIIGACAIISLGGLGSISWALEKVKKVVGSRIDDR